MPAIRSLLPKLAFFQNAISDPDFEAEAYTIQLRWFGLVFEVTLAREVTEQ